MARISTYGDDATVSDGDRVTGTDAVDNSTKNFTVGSLRDHILGTNSVFDGIVPPDRYTIVGPDNFPRQAQMFELPIGETNVAIPSGLVFNLSRDGVGFVIEIRRFGQEASPFPYDIHSFIGTTWVSTEYPNAGEQTISAFLDPRFTSISDGDLQTWRFRTNITTPLSIDSSAGTVGRALTTVVASTLTRRTLISASQVRFTNLPNSVTGNAGNLYTQTGLQLGLTGQDSTKFLIIE